MGQLDTHGSLLLGSSFFWDVMQCRLVVSYPCFGTTYQSHLQGSGSPRNVGNYQSMLRYIPEEWRSDNAAEAWNQELLLLLSFSSPGICIATRKNKGLFSQGCREGWILKISYFLENYTSTDDWQCHIWGRCSYICRTKHGRKIRALWGISLYHRMC